MTNVLSKINKLIREKAEKQGIVFPCSNESVTVELELSNEQLEQFYNLDLSDNYDYEIADNTVLITYTDIDEAFNQLSELQDIEMTLLDLSNKLQIISTYDIFDYVSEEELIENESVTTLVNETEYNVIFNVIEVNEDNPLDTVIEVTEIEYI